MTNSVQKLLTRVRQMRFLTLSFLIHLGLIAFLGGVVLFKGIQKTEVFVANSGTIVENTEEFPDPVDDNATPPEPEAQTEAVAAPTDQASTIASLSSTATFTLPQSAPAPIQTMGMKMPTSPSVPLSPKSGTGGGKSFGQLSGRSEGERAMRLQMTGGKKESEEAVMNGLRWLKKMQSPEGTWGAEKGANQAKFVPAMTGFALLCFLGHGEVPGESVEFGVTVKKAMNALIKMSDTGKGRIATDSYAHAIATYALAEAYAMTKDEEVSAAVIKATNVILKGQADDGGWHYNYSKQMPSDTSVSGWQIQALKTVKLADIHIEGVPLALENALKNIERVWDPKKATFCYTHATGAGANPRPTLNGVGVLSKLFISGREDKMVKDALESILNGPEFDYKAANANLYAWYYNTQACFQAQGNAWRKWNRMFQTDLIKNQAQDGSWPQTGGGTEHGMNVAGDPNGDVYRTTLCILMLEVYYRYSPVSKMVQQ